MFVAATGCNPFSIGQVLNSNPNPPLEGESTKWCGNQLSFSSSHLPALSSQRHLAPRDRGAHAGESVGEKVVKGCGKGKGEEVSPYGDDTTRRNWGRG